MKKVISLILSLSFVSVSIAQSLLKFYSGNNKWEPELGDFDIYIGTNSDTKLKASFVLND